MVVKTLDIKEVALVDLGAFLDVVNHELMQKLGQMSFGSLQNSAQSFIGHTTKFLGYKSKLENSTV